MRSGGIGRQAHEAWNPYDRRLAALEPDDARALMTVTGAALSTSCADLLNASGIGGTDTEGITVTRSFGNPVTTWLEMRDALASYATRAAEKMRRYRVAADNLFVFKHTNTFNNDPFYSNGASARFPVTTNDTGEDGRPRGARGSSAKASAMRSAA